MIRTRHPLRAAFVAALLAAALAPSAALAKVAKALRKPIVDPRAALDWLLATYDYSSQRNQLSNGVYYKPAYSGGGTVYQVVPSP